MNLLSQSLGRGLPLPYPTIGNSPKNPVSRDINSQTSRKIKQPQKMQQTPKKNATKQKKTKKSTKNVPLLVHWASLGQISITLGSLLAAFRALLGGLQALSGGLQALLAALGTLLGRLGRLLGASWTSWTQLGRNLEKS